MKLKRGPKPTKFSASKPPDQLQQKNVQKSSIHLHEMLFELEFNKKMVELWKNMYDNIGVGQIRPQPKFSPTTEEFIRDPKAALTLMEDFNATHRLIYTLPIFATSFDIATKIWHAVTQVNVADLLSIIGSFETNMLVSILEYLVIFQLGTW